MSAAVRLSSAGLGPWGIAIPAAVAVLTFLAFLPTLDNGFVDWDDTDNFVFNENYRGLGWTRLKWMFTAFHLGHYAPLTWVTFGADYLIWGLDPLGYHLTSLLLHAANAVVVYLIALRLLGPAVPCANSRSLQLRLAAAFVALVFAVHPLRVESVAWATERRDVLCGLFYLLAVLVYLRPEQDASTVPVAGRRCYWACLLLFVLALLSKAMAVTLPAVLLLLDLYPLRRFSLTVAGLGSSQARWALLEKLPFFALSALASIGALRGAIAVGALTSETSLRWVDRAAVTVYGLGFYLWKSLVPLRLANLYELQFPFDPFATRIIVSAAGIAALLLLSAWLWHRTPAFLIAFAVYAVVLLPVIGIFHNGLQLVADRYTYLATLPWTVLLGAAVLRGWDAAALASRSRLRVALLGVAPCLLVVVLGALAWGQVRNWHDTASLWSQAVRVSPGPTVHSQLGGELARRGRLNEAAEQFEAVIRMKPSFPDAQHNLAAVMERLDRLQEAEEGYARAVLAKPDVPELRYGLGRVLARRGKAREAIEQFRLALALRPDDPEAHNNLAAALARQGQTAEAVEHFKTALRLKPDYAEAHAAFGFALLGSGEMDRAIDELRMAARLRPESAMTHNNLGVALARNGRAREAADEFRRALDLKPDLQDARRNLDALEAAQGRDSNSARISDLKGERTGR